MPDVAPPQGLEASDYETIEAAVMETARGRWFLLEHARRTRAAEADRMIAALGRLAEVVRQQRLSADRAEAQRRCIDMAAAVEERLLDLAWSLRAQGVEAAVCEQIEREASRLRMALFEPVREVEEAAAMLDVTAPMEVFAAVEAAGPPPLRPEALAVLDRLPTREKLRFFA